ncbi:hypothetical protein [Luteipulveratus flavus]|uniref:Uncharacterized protein n=1 Tax=Luteipulveratus flavus TaxID=3031728 RepID=A0ABT6C8Y5_9MICO|nr:hypothetical protein [Luteipulveratus sp. YIM 133296]MDF8265379.1 hypothetical protein [Luteipulveratus sp. YIM 133296]
MSGLRLADTDSLADLATYVSRARALDADGAVRLQAAGTTLAAWVGVLRGRGLLGQGTVVGLRVLRLGEPAEVDTVVPLAAVGDRLARATADQPVLDLPPMTVRAAWAAVTPPRSGWQQVGEIALDQLRSVATEGVSEVAQGAPEGSGAAAVEDLRHRVWTRPIAHDGGADGLPSGVAFGAYALGFLRGDVGQVHSAARWFRLTTPGGHVLVRA